MKHLILAAAAVIAVFAAGCRGSIFDEQSVLAKVNGHVITKKEMALKAGLYSVSVSSEKDAEEFLNLLINNYLVLEQAKNDKVAVTKEELDREIQNFVPGYSRGEIRRLLRKGGIKYRDWFRDIREKLIVKKEINHVMHNKIKVEDAKLRDYYWSNILDFRRAHKIRARQIVVSSEEQANEVMYELKKGADFAELAKKYSTTSEAKEGGDLGYFSKNDMPAFIANSVFGMKKGKISRIIKTSYGFHIFKVEDIRQAVTPKFEEVRDEVYVAYYEDKKNEYFNKWMEDVRKTAEIEINREALEKLSGKVKK